MPFGKMGRFQKDGSKFADMVVIEKSVDDNMNSASGSKKIRRAIAMYISYWTLHHSQIFRDLVAHGFLYSLNTQYSNKKQTFVQYALGHKKCASASAHRSLRSRLLETEKQKTISRNGIEPLADR